MRAAVRLLSLLLTRAVAAESGVIVGTVSDATTKQCTMGTGLTVYPDFLRNVPLRP